MKHWNNGAVDQEHITCISNYCERLIIICNTLQTWWMCQEQWWKIYKHLQCIANLFDISQCIIYMMKHLQEQYIANLYNEYNAMMKDLQEQYIAKQMTAAVLQSTSRALSIATKLKLIIWVDD